LLQKSVFLKEIEVSLLQQVRKVLIAVVLGLVLTFANVVSAQPSWAASSQHNNELGEEVA
jgi:hypothetical protein